LTSGNDSVDARETDSSRRVVKLEQLLFMVAVIFAAMTCAGFLGKYIWWMDLMANFRVQYFIGLFVACLILLIRKKFLMALPVGAFAMVNLVLIAPLYSGADASQSGATHKAILINVHTQSNEFDRVADFILAEKPDVLAVLEMDSRWREGLGGIYETYPYQVIAARQDNFGIALYSKWPIKEDRVITAWGVGFPSIRAQIDIDGELVEVIATHPGPPVTKDYSNERDDHLLDMAEAARERTLPLIVLSDINASSWSWVFEEVIDISGLRDSRKGFGIQPSWPTYKRMAPLRIPIDHCLVSDEIIVIDRRVGPDVGSDHFPVVVEFEIHGGLVKP
jgi:endonuclease/exonuclease/phosphatase (EEP) superfamily protein YafD